MFGSETSSVLVTVLLDNLRTGPVLPAVKLSLLVDMLVSYPLRRPPPPALCSKPAPPPTTQTQVRSPRPVPTRKPPRCESRVGMRPRVWDQGYRAAAETRSRNPCSSSTPASTRGSEPSLRRCSPCRAQVMQASSREIVENLVLAPRPVDDGAEKPLDLNHAATRNLLGAGLLLSTVDTWRSNVDRVDTWAVEDQHPCTRHIAFDPPSTQAMCPPPPSPASPLPLHHSRSPSP